MATEFLVSAGMLANSQTRVRLGQPHNDLLLPGLNEADISLLRVYSRWADAVVFQPDKTIIIETKIRPSMGPLEALETYSKLFLADPRFKDRHSLPVEKWFVYAIEDPILVTMAHSLGIRPVLYEPKWLADYLSILSHRERRAPLTRT